MRNKRTALYLVLLLIDESDYWLSRSGDENIQTTITDLLVQIADHEIEIGEITEWFRLRLIRIKKP